MREHVAEAWRTSLQVRFVGTVLIVSTAVMLVLGGFIYLLARETKGESLEDI